MKYLLSFLITLSFTSFVSAQFTLSAAYSEGDIPTNALSYDPTCNMMSTLNIELPSGGSVLISGVDIVYEMTATNPGWQSDQRSQVYCDNTSNLEGEVYQGVGNTSGTYDYSRLGVDIANGTYAGGTIISFNMRAWRTFAGGGGACSTTVNKVDNSSWTMTIHYDIDYDGDGFYASIDDCDDLNATIYPEAPEICDGLDNDCDEDIDEGLSSTTNIWTGAMDSDWDNATNWSLAFIPDFCSDVIIPTSSNVVINAAAQARSIEIATSANLTNNGELELSIDPSIARSLDIYGTFDNNNGSVFIAGSNTGMLIRPDGIVQCGNLSFNNIGNTAVSNEGTFNSSSTAYIEIFGSQGISNNGTMNLYNYYMEDALSTNAIINDASITLIACGTGIIAGRIVNNGTITNHGFLTVESDDSSSNTSTFSNNGVIQNHDGNVIDLLTSNNGWSISTFEDSHCFSNPLDDALGGIGIDLQIIDFQVLLPDYFTVAGIYDNVTNTIYFDEGAIGEDNFVIEIENTSSTCSSFFNLSFTNPILGGAIYYEDSDDDGYGNSEMSIMACSAPFGFVADPTDCDDTDATVYPGAIEICDGKDNDCDFVIDDGVSITDNTYAATTDNLWSNPANWSQGVSPLFCHDVVIPMGSTVLVDQFFEVNTLVNHGDMTSTVGGAIFNMSDAKVTNTGNLTFESGLFSFAGGAGVMISNTGNVINGASSVIEAANAFNATDYMIHNDGGTFTNHGEISFPAAEDPFNGNSGLGILSDNGGQFVNEDSGKVYLLFNSLSGPFYNYGCLCQGDECFIMGGCE